MITEQFSEVLIKTSKSTDGNLSFLRGDPIETLKNRQEFLAKANIRLEQVVVMSPQHGTEIIEVSQEDLGKGAFSIENAYKVDGLITNQSQVYLFLVIADCMPIVLFDFEKKALGLIHAGWKGLGSDIISIALDKMNTTFGSQSKNIVAEIGPSIGPCCFKKFPSLKQAQDPKWQPYIFQESDATFGADLWKFAEDQLKACGIASNHIHNLHLCSYHSNQYYSHRRFEAEKLENDYRFATVAGIKNEFIPPISLKI